MWLGLHLIYITGFKSRVTALLPLGRLVHRPRPLRAHHHRAADLRAQCAQRAQARGDRPGLPARGRTTPRGERWRPRGAEGSRRRRPRRPGSPTPASAAPTSASAPARSCLPSPDLLRAAPGHLDFVVVGRHDSSGSSSRRAHPGRRRDGQDLGDAAELLEVRRRRLAVAAWAAIASRAQRGRMKTPSASTVHPVGSEDVPLGPGLHALDALDPRLGAQVAERGRPAGRSASGCRSCPACRRRRRPRRAAGRGSARRRRRARGWAAPRTPPRGGSPPTPAPEGSRSITSGGAAGVPQAHDRVAPRAATPGPAEADAVRPVELVRAQPRRDRLDLGLGARISSSSTWVRIVTSTRLPHRLGEGAVERRWRSSSSSEMSSCT